MNNNSYSSASKISGYNIRPNFGMLKHLYYFILKMLFDGKINVYTRQL